MKKALNPFGFKAFLWQRVKDSNPHKRSQSPVCYLYTNPLYALIEAHIYYMEKFKNVKGVFKKISPLFFFFFLSRPR